MVTADIEAIAKAGLAKVRSAFFPGRRSASGWASLSMGCFIDPIRTAKEKAAFISEGGPIYAGNDRSLS